MKTSTLKMADVERSFRMLLGYTDWFWTDRIWLPGNLTWQDLQRNSSDPDGPFYPSPHDLWIVFPLALVISVVRLIWERVIALPLGRYYGISEAGCRKLSINLVLEAAFLKHRKLLPSHTEVTGLAKQLSWTTRQVERWWRLRRAQLKVPEMKRFQETSWRFLYYASIFWYGIYILWDKPYFYEPRHSFIGHPYQHVPAEMYWYYMVEAGFYVSLLMSLFRDIKRKDFLQMIVHHIITLTLMFMSWCANFVRIGALVLVVHDTVDSWMEGAKLAKYCRYHKLCEVLFVCFTALWFITRLVIYPFWVIYSAYYDSQEILGPFFGAKILSAFLLVLLVLHVIWFCMILRMLFIYLRKGMIEKDERSETEPEVSSEEDDKNIGLMSSGVTEAGEGATVKKGVNGIMDVTVGAGSSGDVVNGSIQSNGLHKRQI